LKKHSFLAAAAAILLICGSTLAWAQTSVAQVDGTVTDSSKPVPGVTVAIINEETGRVYKTKTDQRGKFVALGIAYGNNYRVEITDAAGQSLFKNSNVIVGGEKGAATEMKIDVSNQGNKRLATAKETGTTQEKPQSTTGQIAAIKDANARITKVNALIDQATTAMNAKNWQEAVDPLQQLLVLDPTNWQFYSSLGSAQLNLGQYDQAVQTYDSGMRAAENNTTVDPKNPGSDPARKKAGVAKMLTNQGNAYLKLHKNEEAVAAFTKAAALDPNPGTAYFNLCATAYNRGNVEGALDFCNKAIQADPSRADAYFILGSLLIADSKADKDGKMTAPPGTVETLNKYLELAPDGAHANDVKQMLATIGVRIQTTYQKK
jgi:tetratricopeptide (TPR) repeat protein